MTVEYPHSLIILLFRKYRDGCLISWSLYGLECGARRAGNLVPGTFPSLGGEVVELGDSVPRNYQVPRSPFFALHGRNAAVPGDEAARIVHKTYC